MTTPRFISFDQTDHASGEELLGYGRLIFSSFQANGGFVSSHRNGRETARIKKGARDWTDWMTDNMRNVGIGYLPEAMSMFDLIHRIAYNAEAPKSFTARWTDRYMQSWLRDDAQVSQLDVMYIVGKQMWRSGENMHYQVKNKFFRTLGQWIVETGNKTTPAYERLRHASVLLRADLKQFTSEQETYKTALAKSSLEELPATFDGTDCATLKAYRELAYELFPGYMEADRFRSCDSNLLHALSISPGLNRWERMAYEIEAETSRCL